MYGIYSTRMLEKLIKARQQLKVRQFEIIFPWVIDQIANGTPLSQALLDDHRDIQPTAFRRWVKKNPLLDKEYTEAEEIGAEILAGQTIMIADGIDPYTGNHIPEETERSALRIKTRQWLASHLNKKFRPTKELEITNVSIVQAMEEATRREEEDRAKRMAEAITINGSTTTSRDITS